jgi:hypothetical protein
MRMGQEKQDAQKSGEAAFEEQRTSPWRRAGSCPSFLAPSAVSSVKIAMILPSWTGSLFLTSHLPMFSHRQSRKKQWSKRKCLQGQAVIAKSKQPKRTRVQHTLVDKSSEPFDGGFRALADWQEDRHLVRVLGVGMGFRMRQGLAPACRASASWLCRDLSPEEARGEEGPKKLLLVGSLLTVLWDLGRFLICRYSIRKTSRKTCS